MTIRAVQTPMDFSVAEKVNKRTFRKQILKKGTINYKGQKIDFDDDLLKELRRNFNRGAYDQVPFQFADGKNQHNEDPRNYSGELVGIELTADGVDGIFNLTAEGIKAIKKNPRLGVSARIMDAVEHADGRKFGRSIRHVLATMNPRLTGMRPWQAVDLSEDEETEVVDLTAETIQGRNTMATKKKAAPKSRRSSKGVVSVKTAEGTTDIDLSALSDEEFQGLLDLAAESREDEDDDGVEDVTDDLDDEDDEEDDDDLDDDESDDDDDEEEDEEDEETDLSVPPFLDDAATDKTGKGKKGKKGKVPPAFAKKSVTATRRSKKSTKKAVTADLSLVERLASNEWERERRQYARAGVPPHMLDLAAPILSQHEAVMVDLSNDEQADAGQVLRDMLDAAKGFIDIKPELGHTVDLSNEDDDNTSPADDLMSAWDKEYGKA